MKRALILALSGLVATAVAGCGKKEAPAGAPPEVYVADVVQKDVPVYMELVGQTRGSQDVEIRARVEGYLEPRRLHRGRLRPARATLLYQIDPLPLEAALANAKAQLATAEARLAEGEHRREPPDAPGEAAGGQPAGARQRALRPGRGPRPGGRQKAAVDKAALDLGYTRITAPARRPRGHDPGQGGQPRRPRREHAAHDGLPDRPDPLPGRHQRGRVPAARQAGRWRRAAGRPRQEAGDRAPPGRRHGSPPQGPASTPSSARWTPTTGHPRRPVHVPEPRPRSSGPGSTAGPAS